MCKKNHYFRGKEENDVLPWLNTSKNVHSVVVGRAGRYGSKFPVGEVTCLDAVDLPLLHSSLSSHSPVIEVDYLSL